MEVVAFHRDHPERGLDYAGTFDRVRQERLPRLEDARPRREAWRVREGRSPSSASGRSAPTYFDVDRDGNLVRTAMPSFDELLVVSIRPDSYEVYPIDPVLAADVAEKAIEVYTAKSTAASRARAAMGQPGRWPARRRHGRSRHASNPSTPRRLRSPRRRRRVVRRTPTRSSRSSSGLAPHAAVAATVNRWVRDAARAHVDWRIGIEAQYSTERRYALSYVAVELAEHLCSGGDDAAVEDEVARAALALVIGDDAHQPILAVGGLIGTLTIDQARRLVRIANSARLTFSDDGSPDSSSRRDEHTTQHHERTRHLNRDRLRGGWYTSSGTFMKWEDVGDCVEGRILDFDLDGGRDFDQQPCLQLTVETDRVRHRHLRRPGQPEGRPHRAVPKSSGPRRVTYSGTPTPRGRVAPARSSRWA